MGAISVEGSPKSRERSGIMESVAETTLGSGLVNAMIARQRFIEKGMITEAGVFDEAINEFRNELEELGMDPTVIVLERVRLLVEAVAKMPETKRT